MWKNREIADAKIKEIGELNELVKRFDEIEKLLKEEKLELIENKLRQLEIDRLITGKHNKQSVITSIYAGPGGDDHHERREQGGGGSGKKHDINPAADVFEEQTPDRRNQE